MRFGTSLDETRKVWAGLPVLASVAQLGGPRAGAQILALTSTGGGVVVPLIAVQRYGRGRSMIFAGEGAWRWKMLMPSADRSYEFFWRQAVRWLAEKLASLGHMLRAGDVVLSGALGPVCPVSSGDHIEVEISGLGTVSARF